MNIYRNTLALAVMLLPLAAHAEIYICKDASGRTLTSDRPIMECQDRKIRVLGKNGLTEREIVPPLTEEQKRQKLAEEEKKKADQEVAKEQRRQDMALTARYKNEAEIEVDRKHALDGIREQVKREDASLADSDKRLKELRAAADNQLKTKKSVAVSLQAQIDQLEQSIKDGQKRQTDRQVETAQTNAHFDQSIKRYRELKGGATPAASAPLAAATPTMTPTTTPTPAPTATPASAPARK
ncbi:MAG: DUF4124 domain-containing protein [Proteobacteria bacterium]|nr:DUF4124 domain-containing protein [Pseudomonadota bacterium]